MSDVSFQALRDAPLHRLTPQEWAEWFPSVAAFLDHEDATTRDAALERLIMGVFRAERSPDDMRGTQPAMDAQRCRAAWLLTLVEQAHAKHPDILPAFLQGLRWHGDDEPYRDVLLPWLRGLRERRIPGVPDALIEGAIILIEGFESCDEPGLPPLLDHPSDWVRACAARMLSRTGFGETEGSDEGDKQAFFDPRFIADLTARELVRPGIAGPFWSSCGFFASDYDSLGFDPLEWMLGIIERREGPEPADLPFNGIDFHVHELAAFSPEAVRRLMKAGHPGLALMTATEVHDIVDGMAPVLREFAARPEPEFAHPAQTHLARYYGEAHPAADPKNVRYMPGWRVGVDAFVIRYGDASSWLDTAVFFPEGRPSFSDAEASSIIEAALPADLRGDIAKHWLAFDDDSPGPHRFGDDEMRAYASGAKVELIGVRGGGESWRRLEIVGSRLQDRWQPFGWPAKDASE